MADVIYCFSGTGNSLFVARRLADALGAQLMTIGQTTRPAPEADNVVWVFPAYAWGIAPVMKNFMATVDAHAGWSSARHHMVCTCGDDIGLTARQWRRLMDRRGWSHAGAYSVAMPNTYVLFPGFDVDSRDVERRKIASARSRIDEIASKIRGGFEDDDVVAGTAAWLKSAVIYPLFVRFAMNPGPFRSTDSCVGCGKCAQQCPIRNIDMKRSRPRWGRECAMCLRCYHGCPVKAVAYGAITKGKGQYKGPFKSPEGC